MSSLSLRNIESLFSSLKSPADGPTADAMLEWLSTCNLEPDALEQVKGWHQNAMSRINRTPEEWYAEVERLGALLGRVRLAIAAYRFAPNAAVCVERIGEILGESSVPHTPHA